MNAPLGVGGWPSGSGGGAAWGTGVGTVERLRFGGATLPAAAATADCTDEPVLICGCGCIDEGVEAIEVGCAAPSVAEPHAMQRTAPTTFRKSQLGQTTPSVFVSKAAMEVGG